MIPRILFKAALAASMLLPVVASAQERLNIKPGLWEIKSEMRVGGVLPLPKALRDQLTPEQRAKMAADAKARAAEGPISDTARDCITEKDLEQPFRSSNMQQCRQSTVKTTRNSQEVRIVCDGEHKGAGSFKVTTPNAETMNGTLDLKIGEGPDAFTMNGKLNGRWLGADCGEYADDDYDDYDSEDDEPSDDEEDY